MREIYPRMRTCYERLAKDHGFREGTLTFDATLRVDGTVKALNVDHTEALGEKDFLSCAANAFTSVRFPAPKEGTGQIHYAVSFSVH